MTLMTPLAAEFAASAVFTPTVGSTVNRPPVGDVLTTVPDTPADRNATTWVGLLSGTDIGPVIEMLACIGGFPAAPGGHCCRVDAQVGNPEYARTRTGGIEGNADEGDTVGCGRRKLPDDEVGRQAVLEIDAASPDAGWCGSGGRGVQLSGAGRSAAGLIDQQYGIQQERGRGRKKAAGRARVQRYGDIDERNRGSRRGGKSAGAGEGDIADFFGKAFGADLRGEGGIRSKLQGRVLH